MVQKETKAKSKDSTPLTQNPISSKEVKAFDCSPEPSPAFKEFKDTLAGSIDTDVLPDVRPDVTSVPPSSGTMDDLPEVTESGSMPPESFDSYEPGASAREDLDLPRQAVRTYAGPAAGDASEFNFRRGRYSDDLSFGNQAPMSLPTPQRFRDPYDSPMMSNPPPRSPGSSYQFPPRQHTHFLREHGSSPRGSRRNNRGHTAYPELFELRITIYREVRSLTLFNEFIPEITKMLRLAMREERVEVQGVHKNPHFGVVLTFHVQPYNYMNEKMVTQYRSQMLKLAWDWRNYYDNPRSNYRADHETYDTLYFFLENCEVNLCKITRKERLAAKGSLRGYDDQFRKKPAKQPKNHRSRQNLVKKEYEAVKDLLDKYLIADKTYLRGKKVAFIQVKCPNALKKNAAFITSIVKDPNVDITRATVPLSRKKEGQLKGFLVYLETEREECVTYIIENLFTQEYKDAGIKCKYGVFKKKDETDSGLSNLSNPPESSAEPEPTEV